MSPETEVRRLRRYCMNQQWLTTGDRPLSALVGNSGGTSTEWANSRGERSGCYGG